jgi:hypothetical protein
MNDQHRGTTSAVMQAIRLTGGRHEFEREEIGHVEEILPAREVLDFRKAVTDEHHQADHHPQREDPSEAVASRVPQSKKNFFIKRMRGISRKW